MAIDNHILTITEPTLELDKMEFGSYDEESGTTKTSSAYGDTVPFIHINGYTFKDSDIVNFEIDLKLPITQVQLGCRSSCKHVIHIKRKFVTCVDS